MPVLVERSDDPREVLDRAGRFLGSEPVLHNVILTLLHARVAHPEPGRYWIAADGDDVVGVVFQSPLDFPATLTPMAQAAVEAAVDAVATDGVALPGVGAEAGTAARFAGAWTERHRTGATPFNGQRIYELAELHAPSRVGGGLRQAVTRDRDLLLGWIRAFEDEAGDGYMRIEVVKRRLAAGQFWFWDHDGPASVAAHSRPVEGVVRIGPVYTPPQRRRCGYAGACVAALSGRIIDGGHRAILYTDLSNPVSNSVYRRIGYRAAAEVLRYRFE